MVMGASLSGENAGSATIKNNINKYKSKSAVVNIGGESRNFYNVPPEKIVFKNGERTWTFNLHREDRNISPRHVKNRKSHALAYHGSGGKVVFWVMWSPNPEERFIVLHDMYYGIHNARKPGEIDARTLIAGLKSLARRVRLMNGSYIRKHGLPRAYLPNEYDLYPGFHPGYNNVENIRFPRNTVSVILGSEKMTNAKAKEIHQALSNKNIPHEFFLDRQWDRTNLMSPNRNPKRQKTS